MPFNEAFKLALQSLWGNKLRTILTLIGVVMGVASVIMVITLVNGANKYVGTKLSGYGADVFSVSRIPGVIFSARRVLQVPEAQDHAHGGLQGGTGQLPRMQRSRRVLIHSNGTSSTTAIQHGYRPCAATPGPCSALDNIDIALGRGFTPADDDHATHNVIVGYDIVDNLLGDGDPIGKEIRVDGIPYTIVGVGERQGKMLGQSQDNWVAVPITTYQQTYGYNDSVNIYARANGNAEVMERAKDEVRVLMRARRHDAVGAARRLRDRNQRHLSRYLEADLHALLHRW